MGRGVSSGGGQSSLGYLFGGGEAPTPPFPKPTNTTSETPQSSRLPVTNEPVEEVSKQIPAGVPAKPNTTNNYFRADGRTVAIFSRFFLYLFPTKSTGHGPEGKVAAAAAAEKWGRNV
uniref:Protein SPIRAL1-like 1 n=1 Tax=Salix viminalis TaxID=40686 RepID=A0A6N2MLH6_SALVM